MNKIWIISPLALLMSIAFISYNLITEKAIHSKMIDNQSLPGSIIAKANQPPSYANPSVKGPTIFEGSHPGATFENGTSNQFPNSSDLAISRNIATCLGQNAMLIDKALDSKKTSSSFIIAISTLIIAFLAMIPSWIPLFRKGKHN